MANVSKPSGFKPVQHYDGSAWNGKVVPFFVPSTYGTSIYIGDPVKSGGSAGAAGTQVNGVDVEGMSTLARAAAGDTMIGVLVGVLPLQTDLTVKYAKSGVSMIALVCVDPSVVYEVEESGTTLTANQVGNNFDHVATAGSTSTGVSAATLNGADASGTATAGFRLLGLAKRPDNAIGTYGKWLVMINEHEFKTATGV